MPMTNDDSDPAGAQCVAPVDAGAGPAVPQAAESGTAAETAPDPMAEPLGPVPEAVGPQDGAAEVDTTADASPAAPPVDPGTINPPADPEPEKGVRFVVERVQFKHLDRRMAARGTTCAEDPVALTITPEALVLDVSSRKIACTVQVPYAEGGAPTETASIEVAAKLLRLLARPNRTDIGSKGKRYFEGSVVFTVNIEEKQISFPFEDGIMRVTTDIPTPVRAAFPEPNGVPVRCEALALRRALLAVKPAASHDEARHRVLSQVKVEDGHASALRHQLFAHYGAPSLAGLCFRIDRRDVDAVASLLGMADTTVVVRADEDGVTIEDERQRFGVRSFPEPIPFIDMNVARKPTHAFECDRSDLMKVLVATGLIAAGKTNAERLQIGFSFAVQDGRVHLRAGSEWGAHSCKCSSIPIRMTLEQEKSLRREIVPLETAGNPNQDEDLSPTTSTDAPASSNEPTDGETAKPSLAEEPLMELGYCSHADTFAIVKTMTAPVLSCGFIKDRMLFITGTTAATDARFVFYMETQNQSHGITPRRR